MKLAYANVRGVRVVHTIMQLPRRASMRLLASGCAIEDVTLGMVREAKRRS